MTGLVDARGNPINSNDFAKPKSNRMDDPVIGEIGTGWNAESKRHGYTVPFGNQLAFNVSKLTMSDYRLMRDHYQVNSSLSILTFMIHQMDWRISGDKKKIEDHVDENMRAIWAQLVRALSQAFWSGYAPCATQWENDESSGKVLLTKIKDLPPEECEVHWKKVDEANVASKLKGSDGPRGALPIDHPQEGTLRQIRAKMGEDRGKVKVFDGITQLGYGNIPVGNSFWYPMLMEYGDYYGKKLLNTAYQPWFFSLLIHMYSNRYFERFGEPVPVARAPYDEEIDVNGKPVKGHKLMQGLARQFRNGSAIVLPNNRVMNGTQDSDMFEYDLEFLESQMRGADFDRYLQRLDEEIALSLFTPILLNRTGSGGSFNLGVTHMQLFQWQVNAVVSDLVSYINKYIIRPMVRLNFGEKAPVPKMVFRPVGRTDPETLRAVVLEVVRAGRAAPDLTELGDALGLSLSEIETLTEPPAEPSEPPTDQPDGSTGTRRPGDPLNGDTKTPDRRSGRPERARAPKGTEKRGKLAAGMAERISQQFAAGNKNPDIGYWSKWRTVLMEEFSLEWESDIISDSYNILVRDIHTMYENLAEIDTPVLGDVRKAFENMITTSLVRVENGLNGQEAANSE
ncbi:portal protein [Gordonia phage GordTnk2]|uniref:DUF935-like protein n=1 Tax=Gordonia phage GordTnk2 TaxID=1622192 RepID=A0A0E3XAQ6_9CAUD|nr:portal protein [Gordonia phage GordTnk2]AKC02743.1 DUF935-like protein [Gordonia phage GordTnk2]